MVVSPWIFGFSAKTISPVS
ncbi:SPW repeat protein, partial [Acinetobacter baumannii]